MSGKFTPAHGIICMNGWNNTRATIFLSLFPIAYSFVFSSRRSGRRERKSNIAPRFYEPSTIYSINWSSCFSIFPATVTVVAEILVIGSVDFETFQPTLMGILTNRRSWIVGARRNGFKDEMGSNKLQQEKVGTVPLSPFFIGGLAKLTRRL
jgi:hypothetical protein